MPRRLTLPIVAFTLLTAACGAGTTDAEPTATGATSPPATTATTTPTSSTTTTTTTTATTTTTGTVDIAAFCRATTELNLILLLSAFTSLAGPGAQELQLLVKTPELAAAAAEMARTAPVEFAEQAAGLADLYETMATLAAERGMAASDLADLAAAIEDDSLTLDELFAALGTTPAAIEQLFADAAMVIGDRKPPTDLLGAELTDLGCPLPAATTGACHLLGEAELAPLLGESYTAEATDIQGMGEQCVIRGEGMPFVDITLAGPSFYLPTAWNEIELIEGLGDEAFLAGGMSTPILYVKEGNTVISLMVANTDPRLAEDELIGLMRIALGRATHARDDASDDDADD